MSYIGQTSESLEKRAGGKRGQHYHCCKYFGPAIQEFGWGNFESEILTETEDPEYADLLEWFYTIEFNTQWPNGYNDRVGQQMSDETRKSISEKKKGKPFPQNTWSKGKTISEEQKRKMSEKLKGRHLTEEQKRRLSEANKGNQVAKGRIWFNNGTIERMAYECPEGFIRGRINKQIL